MHVYIHTYTVIARVQCHNYTRGREYTLGNNKSACNCLYNYIGEEVDMGGLKPGSIVGIVLGVIFFLILCIGGILLLIGTRKIIIMPLAIMLLLLNFFTAAYITRRSHTYKCKSVDREQSPVESECLL